MKNKRKRNRTYKVGSECKVLVFSTNTRLANQLLKLKN